MEKRTNENAKLEEITRRKIRENLLRNFSLALCIDLQSFSSANTSRANTHTHKQFNILFRFSWIHSLSLGGTFGAACNMCVENVWATSCLFLLSVPLLFCFSSPFFPFLHFLWWNKNDYIWRVIECECALTFKQKQESIGERKPKKKKKEKNESFLVRIHSRVPNEWINVCDQSSEWNRQRKRITTANSDKQRNDHYNNNNSHSNDQKYKKIFHFVSIHSFCSFCSIFYCYRIR